MTGSKKILFAFLIAVLGVTQVIPTAVFAEEKTQHEMTEATSAVESANVKEVVKTEIKGLDKKNEFLIYSKARVSDTIKVNHGVGRKVYLEKKVNGKWVVKKTYKAAKGDRSKRIKIDYTS